MWQCRPRDRVPLRSSLPHKCGRIQSGANDCSERGRHPATSSQPARGSACPVWCTPLQHLWCSRAATCMELMKGFLMLLAPWISIQAPRSAHKPPIPWMLLWAIGFPNSWSIHAECEPTDISQHCMAPKCHARLFYLSDFANAHCLIPVAVLQRHQTWQGPCFPQKGRRP